MEVEVVLEVVPAIGTEDGRGGRNERLKTHHVSERCPYAPQRTEKMKTRSDEERKRNKGR